MLEISYDPDVVQNQYVGVTPGSTHIINIDVGEGNEDIEYSVYGYCDIHKKVLFDFEWWDEPYLGEPGASVNISWSPEINKHAVDRTDY